MRQDSCCVAVFVAVFLGRRAAAAGARETGYPLCRFSGDRTRRKFTLKPPSHAGVAVPPPGLFDLLEMPLASPRCPIPKTMPHNPWEGVPTL